MCDGRATVDAAWAPAQSRSSPLQPSLLSCIQFPGWTPPGAARNQARPSSKPEPLQGTVVRAPCGFLNTGCQKRVYFGLCILHHTASSPALPQGEVSASAQPGWPSGSEARAPSSGSEGGFPGRGVTTTQLKSVPLLLGSQLRRPGPGPPMRRSGLQGQGRSRGRKPETK